MGIKSRGNFKIELCIKFDCQNKSIKCKECIRFNKYLKKESNK